MRAHPPAIRYALLACCVSARPMEVIDDAVRMTLEVIRRLDPQTEQPLQKTLRTDIKRVAGTVQLLDRIAAAVGEEPHGTVRTVLYPQGKAETFRELAAAATASGPQYRIWSQDVMRQQYVHPSWQMLPWVREPLTLRSDHRVPPVLDALAVITQSLDTKLPDLPAEVPGDGVVLPRWRETVLEETRGRHGSPGSTMHSASSNGGSGPCNAKRSGAGACACRNPRAELPPTWTKKRRARETLRPLLLLDRFAKGTNTGMKRVATANPHYP